MRIAIRNIFILLFLSSSVFLQAQENIFEAAEKGKVSKVRSFLKKGTDINAKDSLNQTALCIAVKEGHYRLMKFLLKKGADINCQNYFGETPLMIAIQSKNEKFIQYLLKKGADVNIQDIKGWTALMLTNQLPVLKLLLSGEASLDLTTNRGETALYIAAEENQLQKVKLLTEAGASINIKTKEGNTAIMIAIKKSFDEIAEYLKSKQ
jgi:ankyrin repeat protein